MKTASIKFAIGTLALAAAATASAGIPLTLSSFQANATLTLTVQANGSSKAAGVAIKELGNTVRNADVAVDYNGRPSSVPQFAFPATKADISLAAVAGGGLPIKVNSGAASGSALRLTTPDAGGDVVLANFVIDFNKHIVYSDIIDVAAKTTKKQLPLFTFTDRVVGKAVLKGLGLNVHSEIENLVFTPDAVAPLQGGLLIDDVLVSSLKMINWGDIVVDVTSKTRAKKVNDAPLTLKQVPAM